MNIFILDADPEASARSLCDKHVVKMLLESAQMLCSPFHLQGIEAPYRLTHTNHPCNVWIRQSFGSYNWLLEHAVELGKEFTFRFGKLHKSTAVVDWCLARRNKLKFQGEGCGPFVQAVPEPYRRADAVDAYRAYYLGDKSRFAKWERGRGEPEWWKHA